MDILSGEGTMVADDPAIEISSLNCLQIMQPRRVLLADNNQLELPPASVTSLKLTVT